jgi:hypothetical protein
VGGQCSEGYRLFDTENARLGRPVRTGGIDKGLGFGNGHIDCATIVTNDLMELNRPTGAPWMQDDNLTVCQVGSTGPGDIRMSRGGYHHHDQFGVFQRNRHV